jgi:hypothetical protein
VIRVKDVGWVGHVARMGEMRNEYELLVGKHEGNGPFKRPKGTVRIILE